MKNYSAEDTLKFLQLTLNIEPEFRGMEYIEALSNNIYKYFEVEYIIIGTLIAPKYENMMTAHALIHGEKVDDFSYALKDSPCKHVFENKKTSVYKDDVTKTFCEDPLIADLSVQSCLAAPLHGNQDLLGLFIFFNTHEIQNSHEYEALITILSSRLSVELEHYINNDTQHSLEVKTCPLPPESTLDKLTGLYNKTFFSHYVQGFLDENIDGVLLSLNLDDFKQINDTYGLIIGDNVLKEFTKSIEGNIRKEDVFSRFSGVDFILFLPQSNQEIAEALSKRIHDSLASTSFSVPKLTVSIGVTITNGDTCDLDTYITYADEALSQAKEKGKKQTVFYSVPQS